MRSRGGLLVVVLVVVGCGDLPPPSSPRSSDSAGGDSADVLAAPTSDTASLRLCAWNVKKLGHGASKDFEAVAGVFEEHCDVAVIVEVMQRQHGHPGYDRLLATLDGWTGLVTDSPRPRTGDGRSEFYAVIWRDGIGVSSCDGWDHGLVYFEDHDGSEQGQGDDRFAREPAFTCLEHAVDGERTVDFMLAAYHATWSDGATDVIAAEVAHVEAVIEAMRAARPGELDLFVMGDFNLVPARLAQATNVADRTDGTGSTLNSQGEITANLYDHLLVADEAASSEVLGNAIVLDVREVAASPADFYRTVSDHLPIVVSVSVGGHDDD